MRSNPTTNSSPMEDNLRHAISGLVYGLRPPEDMTISQWAAKNRLLSSAASASPGLWRNERTPYLVEVMDQLSPQSPVSDVVLKKGAQVGGSEALINTAMYYMAHDPSPIGLFQTTETTAKRFVKQRLNPSISAMPNDILKFTGDEMYLREFPGGVMIVGWSNSASNLRSMPLRVVLCDEISGWAKDCEGEGDPCSLAAARTATFARKKRFWNSTPSIEGECRVTERYLRGDQRKYMVPCPYCGELMEWVWANMVWDKDEEGNNLPATARMKCPHCGGEYQEFRKTELMAQGQWVPTNPQGLYPSYHLPALYAPLGAGISWPECVIQFLDAQGDPTKMKAFCNNVLAEAYSVDGGIHIDKNFLMERCEDYDAEVPDGVVVLTAGVDVQDNRLEVEIVGWGAGLESWGITNRILVGDPSQPAVWAALESVLTAPYSNSNGEAMHVASTLIDAGGHHTDDVYRFTGQREWRNVYACVGKAGLSRPILTRPQKTKKSTLMNASLVTVGVDVAKDQVYDWLSKDEPCPGYCHFPVSDEYNDEYFAQLTAEVRYKKWVKGHQVWAYKKIRARNEAIDKRCYSRAAVNLLGIDVNKWAEAKQRYMHNVNMPMGGRRVQRRTLSKGVSV